MNTRKDNNGKSLNAWVRIAPGRIAKPLRHIGARTNRRGMSGKIIFSLEYKAAYKMSVLGDGLFVQNMARKLK